jgi:hypothetical protein
LDEDGSAVVAVLCHQLRVGADLHQLAMFEDQDLVRAT